MPDWVREELGSADSTDWQLGALRMLASVSRHFGLGESPSQVARRRWWDVLGMRLAMEADIPDRLQVMPVKIVG